MYQKIAIKDKIYDYCKDRITDLLLLRAIYKVDSIQRIISSSPDGFSIDPVGLLSIPTEHEFDLPNYNTYDKEGNIKKKQHLDEMDSFFVDKLVDLDFSKIVKFLDYQYDNTGVEKKKFLEHIKRTEITISKPLIKYEKVRIALLNWIDKKSKQGYNETSKKEQKQIQNENVEWHDKVLDELIENKIQEKLKTQVIQNSHSPKEEEPFLTRKEVSKLLNISLVTLDKWQKAGKIKFHRFESRVRFKWSEIQDKQK
jgi:excisionase family DNA binding protein